MESVTAPQSAGGPLKSPELDDRPTSNELDDSSMQEVMELWLGQTVPKIGHITGPFDESELRKVTREQIHIFTATGDYGSAATVPQIFQHLPAPLLWDCARSKRSGFPTQVSTALQLIKERHIYVAGRDVLELFGFDFSGPLSGEADRRECNTHHSWTAKKIVYSNEGESLATPAYEVENEEGHSKSFLAKFRTSKNPLFPRPWNPRIVLSNQKGLPTDEKVATRLGQIGSLIRAAKAKHGWTQGTRMAEEGLAPTAPTPTPLIHLYAEGVDTPLLQSAQPFQSVETSLLAHRFEAARRSGAQRAGICVLSAAHAFFSVSASCASRAPVANAIPHLNSRIAYWCQCISLARTTLGSMFPRYALEHLPIHSFADNQPIPIGVMVEGITEEHGAELAGKLNARRPNVPVQLARFFVCPVTRLAKVRELVPMLSDDALDAAFEVVMH